MIRDKGQVSLEAIIIIGVIVLGSVVFATFYLSNINKKIDNTQDIPEVDLSNYFPGDDGGISVGGGDGDHNGDGGAGNEDPDPIPGGFCGDNVLNTGEECELVNGSIVLGPGYSDCISQVPFGYFLIGDADGYDCFSCEIDYSSCEYGNSLPNAFFLDLTPFPTASANVNQPYPTTLSIDFNTTQEQLVDVSLVVKTFNSALGQMVPNNACSYDGTQVPATEEGLFIYTFSSLNPEEELASNISCNQEGVFNFYFIGVDQNTDSGISDEKILEFTLPVQDPPEYALCSAQTNSNGSVNLCLNRFSASDSSSEGDATFYVSHPDLSEYYDLEPVCVTNSNGEVCFSLGLN